MHVHAISCSARFAVFAIDIYTFSTPHRLPYTQKMIVLSRLIQVEAFIFRLPIADYLLMAATTEPHLHARTIAADILLLLIFASRAAIARHATGLHLPFQYYHTMAIFSASLFYFLYCFYFNG